MYINDIKLDDSRKHTFLGIRPSENKNETFIEMKLLFFIFELRNQDS